MNEGFIKWLSTWPVLKQIYRQGGVDSFYLAHKDIWDTMKDDVEKMADERAREKLVKLLTVVDERAVVTFDKRAGAIFIGGVRADPARLQNLRSEAEYFLSSDLWKIIYESPKELAQRAMFLAGESLDDLRKGRAILYTLDTQEKILRTFSLYTQPKQPT